LLWLTGYSISCARRIWKRDLQPRDSTVIAIVPIRD
jgi:hypothetical protein